MKVRRPSFTEEAGVAAPGSDTYSVPRPRRSSTTFDGPALEDIDSGVDPNRNQMRSSPLPLARLGGRDAFERGDHWFVIFFQDVESQGENSF